MDLVAAADRPPRPGETVLGRDFSLCPGGKGANQAVAASRLGAETTFLGVVGEDAFGEILLKNLRDAGVRLAVRRDSTASTGVAMIVVQPGGQNSIVVAPGANRLCSAEDLHRHEQLFREADAVLLQLEIPLETVERALELARSAGAKSVLDAGPPTKLCSELLSKADLVSPNETETQAITGIEVDDMDSGKAAAKRLIEMGAARAALKLGERGALLCWEQGVQHFPAAPVEAVDTTAAGDAFTAALAVQWAGGAALNEALEYACYAGAAAVMTFGAQPSMPTAQEVEALMRRFPPVGRQRG
jgi:ribokinase